MKTKIIKATIGTFLKDDNNVLHGYVATAHLFHKDGRPKVENYQRGKHAEHVQRIKEKFNPLAVKPLYLSRRDDGSYRLLDGQQEAIVLRELKITKAFARIVSDLTPKQESLLFSYCNNSVALSPGVKFRSALLGGDPDHERIYGIVQKHGFEIALQAGRPEHAKPVIKAVGVLKALFDLGVLSDTLEVIKTAFRLPKSGQVDVTAYGQGQFIKAVGTMLKDNPDLTTGKAVKHLKGQDATSLYESAAKKAKGNRRGRVNIHDVLVNSFLRICRIDA